MWDCVDCWINKLKSDDSSEGYRILLKYWEPSKIVSAIARTNFENDDFIREKAGVFGEEKKDTVGIYCRGVDSKIKRKMVENQKKFLEKNGNKVVLLTDENSL